jgi:hypothetical protein
MANIKTIPNLEQVIFQIRNGQSLSDIAVGLKMTRCSLATKLKEAGVTKSGVRFDHEFFHQVNTEHKAYWLGFLYADGNVIVKPGHRITIKLAVKDADHLEEWHRSIRSCNPVKLMSGGAVSQHYSKAMVGDLIQLGCVPNKSLVLTFPSLVPKHLVHHFVRGYFDGDGSANLKKDQKTPQLRLTFIGTESFLTSLKEIVNVTAALRPAGNNKIVRALEISGNVQATRVADWMYRDSTVFLKRKKEVCYSTLRFPV